LSALGVTPTAQLADVLPGLRRVAFHFPTQSSAGSTNPKSVLQVTAQWPIARTVRLANTRAGAAGRTEEDP
jgi:hypothetical protein